MVVPVLIGLCPDEEHTHEFFVELHEEDEPVCPDCGLALVVFRREEIDGDVR